MKVKELIKVLKTVKQDANVYVSKDSEGNSFGKVEHDDRLSSLATDSTKNILVIYPLIEHMDYDELK